MLRADTEIRRRGNGVSYTNVIGAVSTAARPTSSSTTTTRHGSRAVERSSTNSVSDARTATTGDMPRYDHLRGRVQARVEVTHLPGIADPAGATVERALPALGYTNVSEVHIGKTIRLVVDATDAAHAAPRSRRCASGCWRTR